MSSVKKNSKNKTSPQAPPRSERPEPTLPSPGRVTCDDSPDEPGRALGDIQRRIEEEVRPAKRSKKRTSPCKPPLPVSGGIGHRNRRRRARPPNAEARRCPSPTPPKSTSWRNGRDPPTVGPVFKCVDCRVWYTLAAQYQNHLASKEHEFHVSRGSRVYWCGVCRRTLRTSNDFATHLASKGHWSRFDRLTRERPTVKVPTNVNKAASILDSVPREFQHE